MPRCYIDESVVQSLRALWIDSVIEISGLPIYEGEAEMGVETSMIICNGYRTWFLHGQVPPQCLITT